MERSVAGTVFSDGKPRIIQIKGIELESEFGPHMLYVTNQDKPGFIGALGTLLGNAGVNIATFHLGRQAQGAGRHLPRPDRRAGAREGAGRGRRSCRRCARRSRWRSDSASAAACQNDSVAAPCLDLGMHGAGADDGRRRR